MSIPASNPQPTAPDLSRFKALTAPDLLRVNEVISTHALSHIALINSVAQHIIAAGGKRLRPSLTIACAKLCGYTGERHIRLAACVEFIHTATLLHDDVVDESTLRRGEQTANAVWGNQSSVLVGDFLLSRAFQLMVADGSLDVLEVLSDASAVVAAGEVHQLMVSHDLSITQDMYEEVNSAKTAALFAAACELGAIVTEREDWREPLRRYGHALGMAFQLADDALDYAASQSELGKTVGDDFREGKITLPVMLAYQKSAADERRFWETALSSSETLSEKNLAEVRRLLGKYHTIEATLKRAEEFAQEAIAALAGFPDSDSRAALIDAAEFAVRRSH